MSYEGRGEKMMKRVNKISDLNVYRLAFDAAMERKAGSSYSIR